jgi:drug/metabolite transporter (DMT)-like permease
MAMNFGAATLLPLAVATTLNYSSAIFAVLLSALILREPTGVWRWSAVAMGFAGVVLIAQPWSGELPLLGAAIALGAALMIALISVQLRDLGRTEHPFTIVFYFSLFSVPVLALAMPIVGKAHAPEEWLLLLACGVIGLLGQVLLTAALRYGAVANVIVMDYSGLIWATLFGWLVFTSLPPASFWFGAPLVVGAGLLIAWREHRLGLARRALMEPKEA